MIIDKHTGFFFHQKGSNSAWPSHWST